jgi:hypothetical protein
MRTPQTVYRGELTIEGGFRVTADGEPFVVRRRLPGREAIHGIAWGMSGTGSKQLAHALVFDATGDAHLAVASHVWVMWAMVADWPARWEVTAERIAQWVEQWRREARRLDWVAVPLGRCPAPAVALRPAVGDGRSPRARFPAGRVRLYPPPAADQPEGGGV